MDYSPFKDGIQLLLTGLELAEICVKFALRKKLGRNYKNGKLVNILKLTY